MAANAFSASTVATLAPTDTAPHVLLTEPIRYERSIVEDHVKRWQDAKQRGGTPSPTVIAVRGDYGSGKTFLLQDAIRTLREGLAPVEPSILLAPCIGGDALAWYRQTIGPALKQSVVVKELMVKLYARAAREVAAKAKLTNAAIERLEADPFSVYKLLHAHQLNRTAVDETVAELLTSQCDVKDPNVHACLLGLIWSETETIAARWLKGDDLTKLEFDALRVSSGLDSNRLAAEAIAAVAHLHTALFQPFALLIDELEHFTRFDSQRRDGESNITWLKRLLETLATTNALVFVAGYWDAWDALKTDSLDRFSPRAPIEMLRLSDKDIQQLVALVSGNDTTFEPPTATLIGKLTGGNIRQVLRMLYVLADASKNFTVRIDRRDVERKAEELGQKLSVEQAILRVEQILTRRGMKVERESVVAGIAFDLVGNLAGHPKVLVEFRDAGSNIANVAAIGDVKRFLSQLDVVQAVAPGALGIFVSEGGLDQGAADAISTKSANCLAFDLSRPDFIVTAERELDLRLGVRPGSGAASAIEQLSVQGAVFLDRMSEPHPPQGDETTRGDQQQRDELFKQLSDTTAESRKQLEAQLNAIEARRASEAAELRKRIDALAAERSSDRDKEVAGLLRPVEEPRQTLHVTFADVTRPVPFANIALQALGLYFIPLAAVLALILFVPTGLAATYGPRAVWPLEVQFTTYALLIALLLGIAYVVTFRSQRLQRFHEARLRLLREIYVRTESPALLIRADNMMRAALDRGNASKALLEISDIAERLLSDYQSAPPSKVAPS